MTAIVSQFDQAVGFFLSGDHQSGTRILQSLQETPGGTAETLLTSVLLSPTDRVLGDYSETGVVQFSPQEIVRRVQRHFYALRLVSTEVCYSWQNKWNALSEELLTFVHVNYVAVNGEILTGDATALASAGVSPSVGKPLLAEYATLAAIVWKLRAASSLASNDAANTTAIFYQLRSQLFSTEFLFQHTPYSHRGMVCAVLIAIVEEFGLFHKASVQRCIPFQLHESTRKQFMSEVLAFDDGQQATCTGMLQLCVDLLTDERDRCQLTLGDGGDPEKAISQLGEVIKVLLALLSWRFSDDYVFDGATVTTNLSDAGRANAPSVLEITGNNKNDAAWTAVLEARVKPSNLGADAPLARLIAPLRDHIFGNRAVDPTQVSELSLLSLVGSTITLLGGLQCAEYAKGNQRNQNVDETISVAQSDLLACLIQLCSVCCDFWAPEQRAAYAGHCWTVAMRLCDASLWGLCTSAFPSSNATQPSAWRNSGCQALNRVITSIGAQDAIFYHPELCSHFIAPLKDLSVHIIACLEQVSTTAPSHHSNTDENAEDELLESLDLLLQGWLKVMREGTWNVSNRVRLGEDSVGIIANSASEVLQAFVTTKIKMHSCNASGEGSETVHAIEYANSNLQLLATIGRESPRSSAFLASIVSEIASGQYLGNFLDRGQEPPVALSEALWYVISICAEFVGDAPDSERPCIAMPFASQALKLERQFPDNVEAQIENSPFFGLCTNVLMFTDNLVERYLTKGAGHVISPGVCAALIEFYRRYIATFLFADEALQSDYSPVFEVVFDSGVAVAKLALQLCISSLHCYTHNEDVVGAVGKLLVTCITLPPQFSEWMFSTQGETLRTLCSLAFENWISVSGSPMLAGSTRGKVLAFLLSLSADASAQTVDDAIQNLGGGDFGAFGSPDPIATLSRIPLSTLDCPLRSLFEQLSTNVTAIISQCASHGVTAVILDVIETLKGGLDGLANDRAAILLFKGGYTSLIENTFRAAVFMFNSSNDKRLIVGCAKMVEYVVGFFVPPEAFQTIASLALELCDLTKTAMEASKNSVQNSSRDMRNFEEDERTAVLSATSSMIFQIASWAVVDFADSSSSSQNAELVPDLVVKGLLTVLRYLDETTAMIPELSSSIFNLLSEVGTSYTASLLKRCSEEDSALVLNAVQFASSSGTPDLVRTACAVMKAFAKYAQKHNAQHLGNLTLMFLRRVASMIVSEPLDPSTIPAVAAALFELTELHGLDALQSSMEEASRGLSGQHINAAVVLCREYAGSDRASWRKAMSPVTTAVERCVLAAQGGRIM